MNNYLSRHSKFDDSHYWRFERNSRIPYGSFETRSERVERIGDAAVGVMLSLAAVFIVLGLALDWFR